MRVDESLKNVRCCAGGCTNFGRVTIETNGFKGGITLCEKCYSELSKEILKFSKKIQQSGDQSSENITKKRK